jgi:hypothetical protein
LGGGHITNVFISLFMFCCFCGFFFFLRLGWRYLEDGRDHGIDDGTTGLEEILVGGGGLYCYSGISVEDMMECLVD